MSMKHELKSLRRRSNKGKQGQAGLMSTNLSSSWAAAAGGGGAPRRQAGPVRTRTSGSACSSSSSFAQRTAARPTPAIHHPGRRRGMAARRGGGGAGRFANRPAGQRRKSVFVFFFFFVHGSWSRSWTPEQNRGSGNARTGDIHHAVDDTKLKKLMTKMTLFKHYMTDWSIYSKVERLPWGRKSEKRRAVLGHEAAFSCQWAGPGACRPRCRNGRRQEGRCSVAHSGGGQ